MGWKEEEEKLQGGAKGLGDDKSLMRAVPCRDHSSPSSSFCVILFYLYFGELNYIKRNFSIELM